MPKAVMNKLWLDITKPYKNIYTFDSRKGTKHKQIVTHKDLNL